MEGGYTFWDSLLGGDCHFNRYDVLYEGLGSKISVAEDRRAQVVYMVSEGKRTFALTRKEAQPVCGAVLYRTEHPKLFIVESHEGVSPESRRGLTIENLDMFTYVNSKFVFIERHVRTQLNHLYYDILKQHCDLERQVLMHTLTLASQAPDEFAYRLMGGPGYMAVVAGEVAHLIKCIPVEITVRHTEEFYHHLPVLRGNNSLFMSPRTHILFQAGTQISCNALVSPMYQLHGAWYKFTPKPVETTAPPQIKPLSKPTWSYTDAGDLATSGIYTQNDLNNIRDHIMFPAERTAVLNTFARTITGHPTLHQGASLMNLLDEETLEKLSASAWNKMWTSFLTFGTASAGILGAILIIRGIKLLADTVIHGDALHTMYGWSVHLLGALWSSVTHLLLHLGRSLSGQPEETSQGDKRPEPIPNNGIADIPELGSAPKSLYPLLDPNMGIPSATTLQMPLQTPYKPNE